MKIKITVFVMLLLSVVLFYKINKQDNTNFKKVFVSKIVDHEALNETFRGLVDSLAEQGFIQGQNLDLRMESAQGNATLATQIAAKFINQAPAVVVGIGTVSAQSLAKDALGNKTKLVFSSITDPLGANLTDEDNLKPNITGVSNFVELAPQLQLFKQIKPSIKRLGIIYNPGESNSVSLVNKLSNICLESDIFLVKQSVTNSSQLYQAAVKLSLEVDAIFISNDNTALSGLQSIIKAANLQKIPVFVSDTDAVKLGALAALGPNQYEIGVQTGNIIANILNGKDMKKIPIEYPKNTELFINLDAAKILGIEILPELITKAKKIIKSE
jgi:putative ABC transport system substrate-binding protein